MYPIRLNLLPPDNQTYLQKMVFTEFTKSILEMLLLLLAIAGITLLGGQIVLEEYFNNLTENIISITEKHANVDTAIKDINLLISRTEQIQKQYALWTPMIAQLTAGIPEGVIVSSMNLNATDKIFSFSGVAQTREDLLAFQKNLAALPFIASTDIPLSQLTEKENASFSLTATLNDVK